MQAAKRLLLSVGVCALIRMDFLCAQSSDIDERTRVQTEQKLLRLAQDIESRHGVISTALVPPLRDLGLLYVEWDRCSDAIPILDHAVQLLRADEGLFTTTQLDLFDPLQGCHLALDRQSDFRRFQEYRVLIAERTFDRKDPAMLPMLLRAAGWYEAAGYYISEREVQARAVDIVRSSGGNNDVRMVEPLRGIARAYRLEYVHGIEPIDAELNRDSPYVSHTSYLGADSAFDLIGETSLTHAVKILEANEKSGTASTTSALLIDTLLQLGDWYQMIRHPPAAMAAYQRAWALSQESLDGHETLFDQPQAVRVGSDIGALRHPSVDHSDYQQYWVDVDYTVDRRGRISDVKVTESNAPKTIQRQVIRGLYNARLRPRFADGHPVDTPHVQIRQTVWAKKFKPLRIQ
jgi:hypothetical protein